MESWCVEYIDNIYRYIHDDVFKNKDVLMRNLRVFKYNTDLEWFNCCLIAKKDNETGFIVNTLKRWNDLLERNDSLELKESSKYIKLLKPKIDPERSCLEFETIDTCFLNDIKSDGLTYFRRATIMDVVSEFENYDEMLKLLKEDWLKKFFECYLKLFDFYYVANEELKNFYMQILEFAFGYDFEVEIEEEMISLDNNPIDKLYIYRNIHNLVVSFHIVLKAYFIRLNEVYMNITEMGLEYLMENNLDKGRLTNKIKEMSQALDGGMEESIERDN